MAELKIREANESDLPEILGVYRSSGLDSLRTLTKEEATNIFRRIKECNGYTIYVAILDMEMVGTFALFIMENLANGGIPSAVVEDVAVAGTHKGKGIGKEMMKFAVELCQKRGCYKLMLSSNAKRVEAHRFYESLGFEKHGFSFRINILDRV